MIEAVTAAEVYRFPRVAPEDMACIDTFPAVPIPEHLSPITSDVLGQLALAQAPFSGRRIACVLAGEDRGYGGHTMERSPTDVDDPFSMAFAGVPSDERLYGIMVAGHGDMKEKHVMPSGEAYDAIAPRLLPGSPIIVIPPNRPDVCRYIPEAIHKAAYMPKLRSVFRGSTIIESRCEAVEYTALSVEDCEFVAHLRHAGLADGIHYYLTGSANGHSGPSYALKPGMYSDLDIIAVGAQGRAMIEACFEDLAEAWYGPLDKSPKVVRVADSDIRVEGCVYRNPDSGICIDFYATDRLETAFVRPEYFARNYYHQLS